MQSRGRGFAAAAGLQPLQVPDAVQTEHGRIVNARSKSRPGVPAADGRGNSPQRPPQNRGSSLRAMFSPAAKAWPPKPSSWAAQALSASKRLNCPALRQEPLRGRRPGRSSLRGRRRSPPAGRPRCPPPPVPALVHQHDGRLRGVTGQLFQACCQISCSCPAVPVQGAELGGEGGRGVGLIGHQQVCRPLGAAQPPGGV